MRSIKLTDSDDQDDKVTYKHICTYVCFLAATTLATLVALYHFHFPLLMKATSAASYATFIPASNSDYHLSFVAEDNVMESSKDGMFYNRLWELPDEAGPGLGQCLTYHTRYAEYHEPLPESLRSLEGTADTLFIIKLQPKHLLDIGADFLLFLRATITEVTAAGMHVVFLVDRKASDLDPNWTLGVSEEFRDRIREVIHEDVLARYGDSVPFKWYDGWKSEERDFWSRSQAISSYFYWTIADTYKYAWSAERDVRLVGGSWTQYFHNMQRSLLYLNASDSDLLLFGDFHRTWPGDSRADDCASGLGNDRYTAYAEVMFYGFSRAYGLGLDQFLVDGKSCWDEDHIPSVAGQLGLKTTKLNNPVYERAGCCTTFSCCSQYAYEVYHAWHENTNECLKGPFILHSFKEEWVMPKWQFPSIMSKPASRWRPIH